MSRDLFGFLSKSLHSDTRGGRSAAQFDQRADFCCNGGTGRNKASRGGEGNPGGPGAKTVRVAGKPGSDPRTSPTRRAKIGRVNSKDNLLALQRQVAVSKLFQMCPTRERMAAPEGTEGTTTMRTMFLTTAAFAALVMGAPVGKAHADSFDRFVLSTQLDEIQDGIDDLEDRAMERDQASHAPSYSAPTYVAPAPVPAPYVAPAPATSGIFVANCTFKNKAIKIELSQGNAVNAFVSVGDETVEANDQQMVDANGAGVGHKIFEAATSTVWYVAPANSAKYRSAVKLNGKWRPLQCGGFTAA
jgi:hypothetical protein